MKKILIAIMMFACFCMAKEKPTHYFEDKWYHCDEYNIVEPKLPKWPKCTDMSKGDCADYDSKGNMIHERDDNDEYEVWYEHDAKGNNIHRLDYYRNEHWYEVWYEHDAKGNMIFSRNDIGIEIWYDYDDNGNEIHERISTGDESWYKWFFDEKNNKKYQCKVDQNGNPTFD